MRPPTFTASLSTNRPARQGPRCGRHGSLTSSALLGRINIYVEGLRDWVQPHVKKDARRNWIAIANVGNWTIKEFSLCVIALSNWHSPNDRLILEVTIISGNCDHDRCISDVIIINFNPGTWWIGNNLNWLDCGLRLSRWWRWPIISARRGGLGSIGIRRRCTADER